MKLLLMLSFIMLGATNLYSQSQPETPYEQKQRALLKQFLMDLGFDYVTAQKASVDPTYANSIEPQIRKKMEAHSLDALGSYNKFQSELEKAKSLMNSEEKEKDRQQVAKATSIENDKKNQEDYLRSDAYRLKKIINDKYTKWATKGEFEKSEDYQKRVADKTSAVRDILTNSIRDYVQYMNSVGNSQGDYFRIDCYIGNYNPDSELLELMFENKKGVQWKGTIKMPPDKAQKIKSGARSAVVNNTTVYYNSAIEVIQDKCQLAFYNGNIVSSKIGVNVKTSNGNGGYSRKYYDVNMATAPAVNLGKDFFTSENLKIDMQGNESFCLQDINTTCNENQNKN